MPPAAGACACDGPAPDLPASFEELGFGLPEAVGRGWLGGATGMMEDHRAGLRVTGQARQGHPKLAWICPRWPLPFRSPGVGFGMEVTQTVTCPHCGQKFDLVIDTSEGFQRFDTDCEICCRPLEVVVECEPGLIISLDVVPQ